MIRPLVLLLCGTVVGAVIGVPIAGLARTKLRHARHAESAASAPPPRATASASAVPSALPAPAPAPALDAVVVHHVVHPPASPSARKSAERIAADAVHAGELRRALALYEQLAAEQPDNEAFADAARILRQRR